MISKFFFVGGIMYLDGDVLLGYGDDRAISKNLPGIHVL